MNYDYLTRKKKELDGYRPLPPALVRNLEEWFRVELTYTSNAIEGNTLTRRETAAVIEKGITVGGQSLREHLEATNHARALDVVNSLVRKKPSALTANDILSMNALLRNGIDDTNAARYPNVPVRISGSAVVMPNPAKVPTLMEDFLRWLTTRNSLHPVAFPGEAHYRLVTIHPFVDGNGRTARLLMNLLLLMRGYPPAIIRTRDRLAYIGALERAQLGGERSDFDALVAKAAERSLDIYLAAARGESAEAEADAATLMKIGALAKAVGVTVPTIRFWTAENLLEVADVTASGYQLYSPDMIARCELIRSLKEQRLTLAEIKTRLG
jgi:Fic family protein